MKLIKDRNNGTNAKLYPGKNVDKCKSTYKYLSDYGFTSELDYSTNSNNLEEAIRKLQVTTIGEELISKNNREISKKISANIKSPVSEIKAEKEIKYTE